MNLQRDGAALVARILLTVMFITSGRRSRSSRS